MALTSGTKLGPYEIISSLGAGGMGARSIEPGTLVSTVRLRSRFCPLIFLIIPRPSGASSVKPAPYGGARVPAPIQVLRWSCWRVISPPLDIPMTLPRMASALSPTRPQKASPRRWFWSRTGPPTPRSSLKAPNDALGAPSLRVLCARVRFHRSASLGNFWRTSNYIRRYP